MDAKDISVTATIDKLLFKLSLPCIDHWNDDHFIVIYKFSKSRVYVSAPAKGLIIYTHQEFKDKWYKKDETVAILMALSQWQNSNKYKPTKKPKDSKFLKK